MLRLLVAFCLLATLSGCDPKKTPAPAPPPAAPSPFLGLKHREIKFGDSVKVSEFSVEGRDCKKLQAALWHLSAELSYAQTSYTFSELPSSFEGKLWLMVQDGEPFGKKDQKVYTLGESIPAVRKRQISENRGLFQGPFAGVSQSIESQDSYESARDYVVLACCMTKQRENHSFGIDTLEALKKHAAETKDEIIAVTIRWEP